MEKGPASSQRVYYVNCPNCGEIVKVVNPKITKKPIRIGQNTTGDVPGEEEECVSTKCSGCKKALEVYLSYRT